MGVHIPLQITIFIYFEYTSRSRIAMLVAQSCPTLCDPMDCSLPGSSVRGIFQARILEYSFPSPGDLPDPGIKLGLLHWRQILYHLSYWEPIFVVQFGIRKWDVSGFVLSSDCFGYYRFLWLHTTF